VSPPRKRDIGLKHSKGDILAFIDDDAYPCKDWLKNAVRNFSDQNVAAVGGPAITPKEDSSRQKASGLVYSSPLVSGKFVYRYLPKIRIEVDDYPSCNFFVRRDAMEELGGFKTNFWPGEDTKFCLEITKNLGKKIIYDPEVVVFHHRREVFLPHIRQIASYALHRGYFVKRYPQTSSKFSFFLPSFLVAAFFVGGIIALFSNSFRTAYLFGVFLYLILILAFSLTKEIALIIPVFLGMVFTHIAYGIYFLKGLLSKELVEEKP